jgi:hypothetical protein
MIDFILEVVSLALLGLPGASHKPSGRYQNADGTMAIEALADKTLVYLPKRFAPFTVLVQRNKIFVKTALGELQFIYDDKTDSLAGPDKVKLNKVAAKPLPAAPP